MLFKFWFFFVPPIKLLAVYSLHLHSISLSLTLRFSIAAFHCGFVHFTPNGICTQAYKSFRRFCSLMQCCQPCYRPFLSSHTVTLSHRQKDAPAPLHAPAIPSGRAVRLSPYFSCFFGTQSLNLHLLVPKKAFTCLFSQARPHTSSHFLSRSLKILFHFFPKYALPMVSTRLPTG